MEQRRFRFYQARVAVIGQGTWYIEALAPEQSLLCAGVLIWA